MIDLTQQLLKLYPQEKGRIGRYSISSLWGLLNGYTSLDEYINGKPINYESALNMWCGTNKHAEIQQLLEGYECEIKKEIKIDDFVIVGKVDAINSEEILEIKTTNPLKRKLLTEPKRWHTEQLKWYLWLFDRPKGTIVQPVISPKQIGLKVVGYVKRDDIFIEKQINKLKIIHKQLQDYDYNKRGD